MKGNQKVIDALNVALKSELTAINQYILHGEMCHNWGYDRLYGLVRKSAIDEMKHAEHLVERILFLDGQPNLSELGKLNIGPNVKAQFTNDLALEVEAVAMYNGYVKLCAEAGDNASRELFEKLLADEEGHVDWLETQLHQIGEVGIDRYLSQQIRG
jgi:bacterioferritin